MDAPVNRHGVETAGATPTRITSLLGRQVLHAVRASVAQYATAAGMENADDVACFARECVDEASRRVSAKRLASAANLHDEALRVAAERCGIDAENFRSARGRGAAAADGDAWSEAVGLTLPSIRPPAPPTTPEQFPQHMPPQPLGELPSFVRSRWWMSPVRVAWRLVGAVLAPNRK